MRSQTFSNDPETELQRLRQILDSAGDGFVMHDLNGNIVDANETLCRDLGYSLEEMLNLTIRDIDDEAVSNQNRMWETLHEEGTSVVTIGILKSKHNGRIPVEIKMFPVEYQGTPYVSAFIRDVTDRKNIEEKLKLTQFAIDQAADAAFWLDAAEHKFIYVNQKACESLGYTQEELVKIGVSDIDIEFTDELWPKFVDELKRVDEVKFETEFKGKDGTVFPVELTANHMEYEGRCYVIAFTREISARRKAEKELRDAKEKAEKASQAKSEFLTSMSHELKTPLNAIIGYSDMLATEFSSVISEEEKHFATSIHQAGMHLLGLINDVLDLATIESGKVNLEFESVSLKDVVEHCLGITSLMARRKEVVIEIKPEFVDYVNVWADRKKFTQIILNLISNAIKYNKKGGLVSISYSRSNKETRIEIKDTGLGIPDDRKHEIFSSFCRLGKENSDIEGTGVGLVICKSLIDLMGGEIGFESQCGVGSCFYLTIPNASTNSDFGDLLSKTGS